MLCYFIRHMEYPHETPRSKKCLDQIQNKVFERSSLGLSAFFKGKSWKDLYFELKCKTFLDLLTARHSQLETRLSQDIFLRERFLPTKGLGMSKIVQKQRQLHHGHERSRVYEAVQKNGSRQQPLIVSRKLQKQIVQVNPFYCFLKIVNGPGVTIQIQQK